MAKRHDRTPFIPIKSWSLEKTVDRLDKAHVFNLKLEIRPTCMFLGSEYFLGGIREERGIGREKKLG